MRAEPVKESSRESTASVPRKTQPPIKVELIEDSKSDKSSENSHLCYQEIEEMMVGSDFCSIKPQSFKKNRQGKVITPKYGVRQYTEMKIDK